MLPARKHIAVLMACVASWLGATNMSCTSEHYDNLAEQPVNLTEYLRASWYVQQQQITSYQKEDALYCVVATYDRTGSEQVAFQGESEIVFSVYNHANKYVVNGKLTNVKPFSNKPMVLCARQTNPQYPARLLVAPCWITSSFAGKYWIIALGEKKGQYEWAVVSGGPPTEEFDDGKCTTNTGLLDSGLWILSRENILDPETLKIIHKRLHSMGYTTSQLKNVTQKGCTYDKMFLKT